MSEQINAPVSIQVNKIIAPISVPSFTIGLDGKSAYESYLDTTEDDPPLSEAEWSASRDTEIELGDLSSTGFSSTHFLRINPSGGVEGRSPEQVRIDIEAAPSTGISQSAISGLTDSLNAILSAVTDRIEIGGIISGSGISITGSGLLIDPYIVTLDSHTHVVSQISDSTAAGRALVTAADAAAQRALVGSGKVYSVSNYGASSTATASENVAAIQAALDAASNSGGGLVLIDVPGIYEVNATLFVYDFTTFEFVSGAKLKKSGPAFGEVIANAGAPTRTTNYGITLRNIRIDGNSNKLAGAIVPGLRGHISLYHVHDAVVDGFVLENSDDTQFALHVSNFYRVRIRRVVIDDGIKDAVHFGPGHDFIVDDCDCATLDDTCGFQPADYPSANPDTGDIYDGVIRNTRRRNVVGSSGFLLRSVTGAWTEWGSGQSYLIGRRCVNAGKVYVCTAPTSPTVAGNAPTHTSGSLTGADGITWRFEHTGTDTSACIRNVLIEDCINEGGSSFFELAGEDVGYNYQITPGQELNAYADSITIRGGKHSPSASANFISGKGYLKRATVDGVTFTSSLSYLYNGAYATGYAGGTDPRGAHATALTISKCHFEGAAANILAFRQGLAVTASFSECTGPAEVIKHGSTTGTVTVTSCNLPFSPIYPPTATDGGTYQVQDTSMLGTWANGTAYVAGTRKVYNGTAYQCLLGHTSATATNRPSDGSSWQTYWTAMAAASKTYRGGIYQPRTPWSQYRSAIVAMEGLAAGTTSNGGTTAVTTVLDANSSATPNGAALVYQNILPFSRGAGEIDFSKPYAVEFTAKVVSSTTNGVSRIIFGKISTTAGDSTVPCLGVEIRDNAIYSHHRNGSTLTQASLGKNAVDGNWTKIGIHSDGSGNVHYYVDGEFAAALTGGPTAVTAGNALLVAETANGGDSSGQRIQASNPRISVP